MALPLTTMLLLLAFKEPEHKDLELVEAPQTLVTENLTQEDKEMFINLDVPVNVLNPIDEAEKALGRE